MQGKIIKNISNLYTVKVSDKVYNCHARGKFRKDKIVPLVGDICKIDIINNYILDIIPRHNQLTRPSVANVDMALIMSSVKKPDLSLELLDKLISIVSLNNCQPVICFSKVDLLNLEELINLKAIKEYYQKYYPVFFNNELDKIKNYLKGNVVVLTGQSGAGKSSILNKFNPDLKLKTNEISQALNRGKHTTRHTELYEINDTYFVDTPGFSSLDFIGYSKEELKQSFKEFQDYSCKFNDCNHVKEPNCGVKDAVNNNLILKSRYLNYLKFLEELK